MGRFRKAASGRLFFFNGVLQFGLNTSATDARVEKNRRAPLGFLHQPVRDFCPFILGFRGRGMGSPEAGWLPQLRALAEPLARDLSLELFDLSIQRQGKRYVVNVVIDRTDGPVKVEDCVSVSKGLEAKLDELDLISAVYVLEVSSPGLDRPLRSLEDCGRYIGCKAQLTTSEPVEGQSSFEGWIENVAEGCVKMKMSEKRKVAVPYAKVKKAKLVPEI
jgi:ribosome maturation factor RimP